MGGNIEFWTNYIQHAVDYAHVWGFLIIFICMTIESSFLPFPSEAVLIPSGFLAYRGELLFSAPRVDFMLCVLFGMAGSVVGAYFNYYFALWLGRPFLYKYGHFFFIRPALLERSEKLFRSNGEVITFVGRFLPGIRHLISIPAGLSKMSKIRFGLFTAFGSGLWTLILTAVGYYIGSASDDMSYKQMALYGKSLITENYGWLFLCVGLTLSIYICAHIYRARKK